MKVWITKYALTAGIEEAEVEYQPEKWVGMVVARSGGYSRHFHGEGREWHRTREDALARCEEMRKAKLASIEKQRKRIVALRFEAM